MPLPTVTNNTALEADIVFNAANLALSKTQRRLFASKSPPSRSHTRTTTTVSTTNETPKETGNATKTEDQEKDFTSIPDSAGLGAGSEDPDDETERRTADDELRKMLLGNRGGSAGAGGTILSVKGTTRQNGIMDAGALLMGNNNKPHPIPLPSRAPVPLPPKKRRDEEEDDDDEEGGRSSLGKARKKNKPQGRMGMEENNNNNAGGDDNNNDDDNERVEDGTKKNMEKEGKLPAVDALTKVKEKEVKRGRGPGTGGGGNYLDEVLAERLLKRRKKAKGRRDGNADG